MMSPFEEACGGRKMSILLLEFGLPGHNTLGFELSSGASPEKWEF
jgi:hypothetical protein